MPVHFDEHHLSEVQNTASEEKLDQVVDSMKESKVAIIGEWRGALARGGKGSSAPSACGNGLGSDAVRSLWRVGMAMVRGWRRKPSGFTRSY